MSERDMHDYTTLYDGDEEDYDQFGRGYNAARSQTSGYHTGSHLNWGSQFPPLDNIGDYHHQEVNDTAEDFAELDLGGSFLEESYAGRYPTVEQGIDEREDASCLLPQAQQVYTSTSTAEGGSASGHPQAHTEVEHPTSTTGHRDQQSGEVETGRRKRRSGRQPAIEKFPGLDKDVYDLCTNPVYESRSASGRKRESIYKNYPGITEAAIRSVRSSLIKKGVLTDKNMVWKNGRSGKPPA